MDTADIPKIRRRIAIARGEYEASRKRLQKERDRLSQLETRSKDVAEARSFVQVVAESVQRSCHDRIASVVSRCLETIFGEDAFQFEIDFDRKRGKTEAILTLSKDGHKVEPLDSVGGGVVDVVAFALRIASIVASGKTRLVVLDEPFKHLSRNLHPKARMLVESMARDLEIQFILVTHSEELQCGKIVEIS